MTRDLRMPTVACVAWASALLCVFVPGAAWWCAGGGIVCAAACAVELARRQSATGGAVRGGVLVVLTATAAAVALSAACAAPGRQEAASWAGRVVEAVGTVASSASIGDDGRLWIDVHLSAIGSPDRLSEVSAPVRVGIDGGAGYDLGATVRVRGETASTDVGERAALVVFASASVVERPASGVFAVAAELKRAFRERSVRLPEPGAGLLPGLAIGDTTAVDATLDDDMRASGLSHLTAVSGANCAIVVGAVFWLVALCGGGRAARVTTAGIALAGFVVLVTPEPSVIRAATMAGVSMLAVLLGRPSAGAGLLALCASGILIADPWLAATPGFALSVAASGALILLAPPLARWMQGWMPMSLALAVAVPLAAQLVCGPIIALFAEQQSLVGIAANMIAAPAAPVATVIGLLACLAAPIPALADLLTASAWLPAAWIASTAGVSAHLPLGRITLVPGIGSAVAVAAVSAAIAANLTTSRHTPPDGTRRTHGLMRGTAGVIVAVTVAAAGSHVLLDGPLATATTPSGWSIAACDVGQGDAAVVRSEGAVALIDTGPQPEPLAACLRSLGVDRIALLVLTHFDLDHAGGVEAVQGRVDRVLHSPPADAADERTLAELAAGGAVVDDAAAGLSGAVGDATWRVLWPPRRSAAFPHGNDASVVTEFSGGGVPRSIFLGDLSAAPQRMLLRTVRRTGGYEVVKVAHHGSADQEPGLYDALRPAVALISVGAGNDYGHPRSETLSLLEATGARVLRTDDAGRIVLRQRGGRIEVWTENDVGARR